MKYKVGDKVKVREDLVVGHSYGTDSFMSEMCDMRGKVVTIEHISDSTHNPTWEADEYQIEEQADWWWTDEMFEGLYIGTALPAPKISKSLLRQLGINKVVFDHVTTIVILDDGSLGKSTASEEDEFDWWVGFTVAYTSACLGGKNKLKRDIEAITNHTDPFFKSVVINVN